MVFYLAGTKVRVPAGRRPPEGV